MNINSEFIEKKVDDNKKKEIISKLIEHPKIKLIIEREKITKKEFDDNMVMFFQVIEENEDFEIDIRRKLDQSLYKVFLPTILNKKKSIEKNLWLSQISKVDRKISMKDMLNDKHIDKIENSKYWFDTANAIRENKKIHKNNKGIYIYGNHGLGKTHFAQAIINAYIKTQTVAFVNTTELYTFLKSNFGETENKVGSIVEKMKHVQLLILDDIGAEPISGWFRDGILMPILTSRMNEKLLTFFTSNYSLDQLLKIQSNNQNKKFNNNSIDHNNLENAKRLIQRIKALSISKLWKGKNLRT